MKFHTAVTVIATARTQHRFWCESHTMPWISNEPPATHARNNLL